VGKDFASKKTRSYSMLGWFIDGGQCCPRGKLQAPPSNVRTDSANRASQTSRAMVARKVEKKKVRGGESNNHIAIRRVVH
jgi:hypothetical protein